MIMSILIPNYTWMAKGFKDGHKQKLLNPLKGYKVILFPDKTEYGSWADKTTLLTNFSHR